MLEAWLALTNVDYHRNLQVLIPLNQWLALTILRATGPSLLAMKIWYIKFASRSDNGPTLEKSASLSFYGVKLT